MNEPKTKSSINGKQNPEYLKWWQNQNREKCKASMKMWRLNNPEKVKAMQARSALKAKESRRENGQPALDQAKCVSCGTVYNKVDAYFGKFKMLNRARGCRCICVECQ